MRRALLSLALVALAASATRVAHADSLRWTCPCGGEVLEFAPGDASYMERMVSLHAEQHCGGGGSSFGSVGTDPVFGLLRPVLERAAEDLGEAVAREIFGYRDPAEQQRLAELRRLEQERLAALERERQEELARRRRELHRRLLSDMAWLGSGDVELPLMELDGASRAQPSPPSPTSLPLLEMDDALRPAGTAFFGGGGGAPAPTVRAHVVELRDLRCAAYLVERARGAAAEDRVLLLDEALRALEGDASLLADAPSDFRVADGEEKLAALRARQARLESAARELGTAESRAAQAEWVDRAARSAVRRAEEARARLRASGAAPAAIARQGALLEELRAAATRAGETLDAARRERDLAHEIHDWARWGRREQVATLDGSAWAELTEAQQQSRASLERIYRRKIDVPPPEIPGSIARAENGRRALAKLGELEAGLAALPEAEQARARESLVEARRRAELMDYYDRVINAHTRERVQSMGELSAQPAAAEREVRSLALTSFETLDGMFTTFRKDQLQILARAGDLDVQVLNALEDKLEKAASARSDLGLLREGIRSGSLSVEGQRALSNRIAEQAQAIAEQELEDVPAAVLKGAEQVVPYLKAAKSLAQATQHTLEVLDLHQQARMLDERLGDQARQLRQVQEQYERQVDGFQRERRALEALQATRARALPAPGSP